MALIKCWECNQTISNTAAACPTCGAPTSRSDMSPDRKPVVTIQRTSKRLKMQSMISGLAVLIGFIWLGVLSNETKTNGSEGSLTKVPLDALVYPILIIFFGIFWFLITRIRIWWHHE
jgi:uncharacterized membrane protein YvbJ